MFKTKLIYAFCMRRRKSKRSPKLKDLLLQAPDGTQITLDYTPNMSVHSIKKKLFEETGENYMVCDEAGTCYGEGEHKGLYKPAKNLGMLDESKVSNTFYLARTRRYVSPRVRSKSRKKSRFRRTKRSPNTFSETNIIAYLERIALDLEQQWLDKPLTKIHNTATRDDATALRLMNELFNEGRISEEGVEEIRHSEDKFDTLVAAVEAKAMTDIARQLDIIKLQIVNHTPKRGRPMRLPGTTSSLKWSKGKASPSSKQAVMNKIGMLLHKGETDFYDDGVGDWRWSDFLRDEKKIAGKTKKMTV